MPATGPGSGYACRWPRFDAEVMRLCKRLMIPGLFGAGVIQINLAVSTILASLHPASVSYHLLRRPALSIAAGADRLGDRCRAAAGPDAGACAASDPAARAFTCRTGRSNWARCSRCRRRWASWSRHCPSSPTVYQRGAFTPRRCQPVALALMIMSAGPAGLCRQQGADRRPSSRARIRRRRSSQATVVGRRQHRHQLCPDPDLRLYRRRHRCHGRRPGSTPSCSAPFSVCTRLPGRRRATRTDPAAPAARGAWHWVA